MDPQLYFTFKSDDVLDTSKSSLPFLLHGAVQLIQTNKKSLKEYLAIHLLLMNCSAKL